MQAQKFTVCAPLKAAIKSPFPEIQFIRLASWRLSPRRVVLAGGAPFDGRIYCSYDCSFADDITLEFCSRGSSMSLASHQRFNDILAVSHVLEWREIVSLREVFNEQFRDGLSTIANIEHAQVGTIAGKQILASRWTDRNFTRKCISLYFISAIDDVVREMHFAAPIDLFDCIVKESFEVVRSIQWINHSVPFFEIVS